MRTLLTAAICGMNLGQGAGAAGLDSRPRSGTSGAMSMSSWIAIGIAIGAAIGSMMDNIEAGVGIGVAIGVALGLAMGNRRS